jgi:hypothetical protein
MLRRDRQLRVQVNQLIDGGVFALGLWLAWVIRYYWAYFGPRSVEAIFGSKGVEKIFGTKEVASIFGSYGVDTIAPFQDYFWLFLVVIPLTPIVLEWQGFYERLVFSSVKQMAWQLAKACTICVVGLILIDFMLKENIRREASLCSLVFAALG